MKTEAPRIENLSERSVAFVSYTGNYMANPQVFKELFDNLCAWAGPKGLITATSVFLAAYQDDPRTTPPEALKLDLCLSIPDTQETEGEIAKKVLPGGKYAVMTAELTGPEEYGAAWMAVVDWLREKQLEIDMTRPSYEMYLNNPEEHPQKHHVVDICMSIK